MLLPRLLLARLCSLGRRFLSFPFRWGEQRRTDVLPAQLDLEDLFEFREDLGGRDRSPGFIVCDDGGLEGVMAQGGKDGGERRVEVR